MGRKLSTSSLKGVWHSRYEISVYRWVESRLCLSNPNTSCNSINATWVYR